MQPKIQAAARRGRHGEDWPATSASALGQQLCGDLDHDLLQSDRLLNCDFRPVSFSRQEHDELASTQNQLRRRGPVIGEFLGVRFRLENSLLPKGLHSRDVDAFDSLDEKLQIDGRWMVFPGAEFAGLRCVAVHIGEPAGLAEFKDAFFCRPRIPGNPEQRTAENGQVD